MNETFDVSLASQFFERPADLGFIYLLSDRGRYKIGRTKLPKKRLQVAKTWIPDTEVIAMKPFWFHSKIEACVQVGLAPFAYQGEWFDFNGDEFEEVFLDEFRFFSDDNPIKNVQSFTYFMNGTGMSELTLEWSSAGISKRRFLKETSIHWVR